MFPYRLGFSWVFFSTEVKNKLTKIGRKGTTPNHDGDTWKKFLLLKENTDSINSKDHICPQVKIMTGTKFRRLFLPSETSAECYKRNLDKNLLSLEKYRHRKGKHLTVDFVLADVGFMNGNICNKKKKPRFG